MTLPKRNVYINDDTEVESIVWSGDRADEKEFREFCGDQLNYIRDDGIASIGAAQFITDFMVAPGDFVVRFEDKPLLRLPGSHWLVQAMFNPEPRPEQESPDA